jgi:regulator of extracellular matrix RemA (YlzA/DUF370 family)
VLNVFGEIITSNTVATVVAPNTAALKECVRYIDPTKIEVETRKGVNVNRSF